MRAEVAVAHYEFRNCFSENMAELGELKIGGMEIRLANTQPVLYQPYCLFHSEREFVKEHIVEVKDP